MYWPHSRQWWREGGGVYSQIKIATASQRKERETVWRCGVNEPEQTLQNPGAGGGGGGERVYLARVLLVYSQTPGPPYISHTSYTHIGLPAVRLRQIRWGQNGE
jgi:hypothetical protein